MLTADEEESLRLIRVEDVRKLVPVSERTLARMVKRGDFPQPLKRGGVLFWNFQKVRDWLQGVEEWPLVLPPRDFGDSEDLI